MYTRTLALLVLMVAIGCPVAAVTITERPDTIMNGQPMYVTIQDLPENASFSLLVQADCAVQPNSEFRFQMSQFVMPFALKQSSITATLSGTSQNRLEVMKESTIVTVSGTSTDGHFSTTKTYDISPGTYDYFRLSGTSLPSRQGITAQLQVTGTKQGPRDSEISFIVEGLTAGTLTLAVLVDGTQVHYKTVPVGGADSSSSATGSGMSITSTAAPPPGQWNTFTSADGMASITVSQTGPVGFLMTPAVNVTPGMRVLSGPYSLVPQDTSFLPPGKIALVIPAGAPSSGLTIASFANGSWTALNSTLTNATVTAPLTRSGTYALIGPAPTRATTVTTMATTVPMTANTTPVSPQTPAPAPPTKAGLESLTLFLAIGTGCAAALRKRE
ncbi:MAG: hypothetical protein MUC66_09215 [Methanolinea sp.]|nr:hypothetical protein [Methanolinea sp.]